MTTLQKTFALLLCVVVLVLIYFLNPILAPFLAGIIIAYLGDPLVAKLEEIRVHRAIGALDSRRRIRRPLQRLYALE